MRTEPEMLELVRFKLVQRRRRRRTAAASAGGGVAAVLLIMVLALGGSGADGAIEDVKAGEGPGGGRPTTTEVDERPGIGEEDRVRDDVPPTTAPDGETTTTAPGGADATDPGSTSSGPDATDGGDPDGDPDGGGGDPGSAPDEAPVDGSDGPSATAPTTTTSSPATTTTSPPRPWSVRLTGADGDMTMDYVLSTDPARPGIVSLWARIEDPTGTDVHSSGYTRGPSGHVMVRGGPSKLFGEYVASCGHGPLEGTAPGSLDVRVDLEVGSGRKVISVKAGTLVCHSEVNDVYIDQVVDVP